MLHSCYRRTGGVVRVGEPDDRVLAETAEGLREPEVGRSGEGGSSPGMGTRVRNPSTTKARGPGETTRCHGPRHVRAQTPASSRVIPRNTADSGGVGPGPAAADATGSRARGPPSAPQPGPQDPAVVPRAVHRAVRPSISAAHDRNPVGAPRSARVVALIIRGFAILQGFHRLFWGEYSGSGCYIVVTAGREGS